MGTYLLGLTEFAKELGIIADRRKLTVYYSRGKFPSPIAFAGPNQSRPLWTKEQVRQFKEKRRASGLAKC